MIYIYIYIYIQFFFFFGFGFFYFFYFFLKTTHTLIEQRVTKFNRGEFSNNISKPNKQYREIKQKKT